MSLLNKASIITTPTAYAEDFLYNIKPAGGLGDELVTNGTFDTDSNWNKSATFTISNGRLHCLSDGSYQYANQANVFVVGRTYKLTFEVVDYTSGVIRVRPSGQSSFITASANGIYTFFYTATNTTLVIERHNVACNLYVDNVSVKEVVDFDFDRNSTGTRVNEDYLIEDVPYNLLPQSNTFETTWQLVNATLNDGYYGVPKSYDAWLLTKSAANGRLNQFTSISSQTHTYSVYAKANDSSWMKLQVFDGSSFYFTTFNLSNGSIGTDSNLISSSIEGVRDGWYRCSIQFSAAITVAYIYPADGDNDTSGASGSIYIQNAQLVKGDQPKDYLKTTDRLDIPRIDYTNGEPSILLEPSRTNVVPNSEDFTTNWTTQGITLTANQITSPDGNTNGGLIQSTSTGSCVFEPTGVNLTIGVTYTYSFFVKKGNNQWVRLAHISSGVTGCWFDLDNGVLGTVNSQSATIDKYPNGWYRITNTFVATHSSSGNSAFIGICDNNGSTNAGVIGQNVYIYGAQVEAGSYATSLIHTSGSAVTRSADAANNAGNSDLISSTEGVLYAEIKALADDATNRRISISDGTTANRMYISYKNYTNQIRAEVISSSSSVFDATYSAIDITIFSKIALKYKLNDFSLYIDGVEVANDTSGAVPTGLKELAFDDGVGNNDFYGNAKMVAVFKEALSDEELACLTGYNNHELYMNYYNRLSYLGLAEEYNVESDINNYIL